MAGDIHVNDAGLPMVNLRLIGKPHEKVCGEQVTGLLCSQGRHSMTVHLNSPFIDGHHIMMSMPDGTSCQLEVLFTEEDKPKRRAKVMRFDKERDEKTNTSCFVVELEYLPDVQDIPRSKIWEPFMRKAGQVIKIGDDF